MRVDTLLRLLQTHPDAVEFQDVMAVIAAQYDYTPTRFSNGLGDDRIVNAAGENEGSCKIFALGQLLGLNQLQPLACFGRFYREDVMQHPRDNKHANIRCFMRHGWAGIHFDSQALTPKGNNG
jgi:hypothetical protein